MTVRSLAFRTDLALLTRSGSTVEDRGSHLVVRTPDNPAYHWGNFLLLGAPPDGGPPALAAAEAAFHDAFPDAGHVSLGFDTADGTLPGVEAYGPAGWTVGRDLVLTAEPATLRPPEHGAAGATVRPLASEADWTAWADLLVSQQSDPDDAVRAFLAGRIAANRRLVDAGYGTWFGAFLGDRLGAGLGLFATGDATARYQEVHTHADLRRRGLAGAAVHHAARWAFDRLDCRRLVLVADPDGPAVGLYRSLGFAATETQLGVSRS